MELTGNYKSCTDKSGGVRRISLARVSWIESIVSDRAARRCSAINFAPGKGFVPYHFREDTAWLRKETSWKDGAAMVTHELKMAVDPVDANTAAIVEQMAEASARDGMVALVETAAGEKLLVGYSGRFSLERPLRLHSSADSTGTEKTDIPLRIITLRSVDSAPSMGCTAEML